MYFKFIGNPNDPEDLGDRITSFGYDFVKGEAVEVTDKTAAAKFYGNSHFEAVDEQASDDVPPADDTLKGFLGTVDPEDDANWTGAGKIRMDVVEAVFGQAASRKDVDRAWPKFDRDEARRVAENSDGDES